MTLSQASIVILLTLLLSQGWAQTAQTCSRMAIINSREVMVDTSSTQKGEGLRYYLNKDPVAKSHLDIYQQKTSKKTLNAILGTAATGSIIAGLLTTRRDSEEGLGRKEFLLLGGAALFIVNYFVSITLEHNNETHLEKAVQEYNKRNLPRIYFSPFQEQTDDLSAKRHKRSAWGVSGGVVKEF